MYIFDGKLWGIFDDGTNRPITESDMDFIGYMIDVIRERYPQAYEALCECYKSVSNDVPYYQYLIVNRFTRCNFGTLDNTKKDISNGELNLEVVSCPLRGECQYECRICKPKFNSKLSSSEMRVMELWYKGMNTEQISKKLFISTNTVKIHVKSAYLKLGIHDKGEFIRYANQNNMFND